MARTDWVDCSRWQGVISATTFAAWKAAGVVGVILKMGGGDDGRYEDRVFNTNYGNALAGGLLVQGYWFNGTTDAIGDADFVCGLVRPGFFIWADVESEGSMPHWSDATAGAFEARVELNGRRTGTYMSQSVTFGSWPSLRRRPLWVADYGPDSVPTVGSWDAPVLWQHTSSGRMPGYGGPLDLNEAQPGFAALISTIIPPKKEDDDMAFLPICIQNHEGGPAVPGIAIFSDGYVEAITASQWDAFGYAGAKQYYTTVSGHFAFFLDQAARVRASYPQVVQKVAITADTLAAASVTAAATGQHATQAELTDAVARQFAVALGNEHGVQFSPESAK